MRTNLVQTFKESAKRINLNHIAQRVALISLFIILGIGNAWAYSYYSRFTAKSGNTAQGLVYAAGSDSEGSINDYTNQVTPAADDGTSGAEYTWHAWAKAARGYRFKTWTKGSNINSNGTLTEAHCTFGVKHSTSNNGYVDGDATATFESATAYTLTFKQPQNFGGYTAEYANYTISSNKFTPYAKTITMTSATSDKGETSYASDEVTLTATARLGAFLGWYVNGSKVSDNAGGYTFNPSATCNVEGRWEEVQTNIPMHFKAVEKDDNDNYVGSYTVGGQTVQATDYNTTTGANYYLEVTLTATPAAGYVFTGWYTKEGKKKNYISYESPYNAYFDSETTVYANFVYSNYPDDQKAQFKVGSTTYYDLNEANTAAGSSGTIICVRDGILPPGNYTISSGVKLYIPYSTSETYQTTPAVVTTAETLSAYRKLTFAEGANITCNGIICVGGKLMSAGGGKPSSYPTGPCGVIDMSRGGHIELNNKAKLYCWGFIIGQDKDQGDNTNDVGTIMVNSGAVVWEGFASGDWRGGTACLTIYNNRSSWKFFPFQSYTIQNVEVPTTYKYGSTLSNYMNVYGNGGTNAGNFNLIGSSETLFLLKDDKSLVRKWYDATTDLVCYEMSGTTLLNELNVDAGITTVSSKDYNLPISTSMHIILTNCSTEITKPMEVQAGAVVEVKSDASLTCSSNVYLFDKDNWGQYCYNKYYYTMTNLTIHKDRGNGTSNAMIDDAKIVVDGTLNVTGKMYSTAGGADIMGNGGGTVTFGSMASGTNMVMCTGVSTNENVAINQANLHNEDSTYTQAASSTFYNVNGRWFISGKQNEKADHTYDFKYISSGAVSGTGGTTTTTDAVYSWDKTGLELRQKWANVDKTGQCPNWWLGTIDGYLYNWTFESAWHQFMPTATEDLYSGSNNKIYTKTGCDWEELGETDENCLYTILGVKKALVDGHFLELVANNNDPAYHLASDASKYYICFAGCNWHEADKYTEAQKAYIIEPDTFIWYDNAWMSVNFQKPFAYTLDETNVPIYYEYLDGEWVLAEPYVRVKDGLENRTYWFLKDAFAFASNVLRTAPTITILRDISGITTAVSYTGTKTCTLDLNGHTITGTVSSMLTINGTGCTFIIKDGTTEKLGKIDLYYSANARRYAVNVTKGHLKLQSGTISAINTMTYNSSSAKTTQSCAIIVKASQQCTIEGGKVYAQAGHNPFGIYGEGNSSTITVKGGEVIASVGTGSEPRGIQVTGGTLNVQDDAMIEATTYSSGTTGEGILVNSAASYFATLNMTGGTVKSTTKTSSIGILVNYNYTYDTNQPRNITAQSLPVANIFGGEIQVMNANGGTAEGIRSFGTTNISGGKITVRPTTTTAFGVRLYAGKTTISGTADIDVSATSTAYGVRISQVNPYKTGGLVYNGTLEMTGGTLTVRTSSTTDAYGVYVGAGSLAQTYANDPSSSTYKSYYAGNYANAGTATISGGVIDVQAKTNKAYAVYVAEPVSQSGATGYETATATPNCSITGGKFKVASMTASATNIAATNVSTSTYTISGGYYNNQENVAGYTTAPKHVITLPTTDANYPEYLYKVANSYLVTFMNGSETLQSTYQEEGKIPAYSGAEPTKASAGGFSYAFNGWSTSNNNTPAALTALTSAGATYYACFEQTDLRYTISLDATTNGGECATEYIRVVPGAGAGTLPSATKEGHTFTGWFTAASGGTQLTSSTVVSGDITYYAQFSVNSYTLTYALGEGKVSTAGSPIPAKNATGNQSQSVAYGTAITAPVVTRTGYTFQSWDAIVAATMPAQDVTYTPLWIPNVNTKYTVKHYLQNVDGTTYPAEPYETQSLTGTTATSVTPAVKSYEGFVSPAAQTVTIGADGKTVVTYQYARMHYTFTLDAATNGGTTDVPSIDVIHGATIGAVPPDAEKGCNDFLGWFTKPTGGVKITSDFVIEYDMKKLYAQFSDDIRTWPINYQPGANGGGTVAAGTKTCDVNATITSSTFTRTGYTQTGWSTTDGGAQEYAFGATYTENATLTLYPVWTINKYTVTWKNGSATIETDPNVNYGTMPSFDGTEPTKPIDASYAYTFDGWSTTDGGEKVDPLPAVSDNTTYYAHYSTTPTVASVTVGTADPTYYTNMADAFAAANAAESASTIKMLNNVSDIAASLVYSGTQNCTLDLNNHTIAGIVNKLIDVNASGKTFTIDDSSTAKGGKISTKLSTNARLYALFITAGTVNLKHGTIYSENPHTYTTAAANKNSAASAVYVTAGQTFTMDDGTLESVSQYSSYALFIAQSTTSVVTINGGLIKGRTSASTTAGGIYNYCTKLTINGGHIIGHAYTSTSYGINLLGKATINGGIIEATNDTTSSKGTTTAYGIYTQYKSSTYKGVITIPSTSTVQVLAKARTNTAYAVYISSSSSTGHTIAAGTFTAKAKTGKTAGGVYTFGTITISGGTFNVSTATTGAYGIYTRSTTTTVNGNPTFNVTSGTTDAYGAFAYGYVNAKGASKTSGTIKVNGGTFNVTSGSTTAYGAYAGLYGLKIEQKGTVAGDTIFGQHYMPGIIEVTDGTFNVKATTTGAYGIVVAGAKSESGAVGTTTRYPQATIKGGKYKAESLSDANATAYAMNTSASASYLKVQGGKYSTKKTGASTNIEGKYTAPTKSCNYWVLPLTGEDPYLYEVAEAYKITFKNGETTLQDDPIKKNTTPVYNGADPTKDPAGGYTYTFDGWSITDGGDVVSPLPNVTAAATYYAHFNAVSTETGPWLDIVDAHDGELVINMTSLSLSGWPYQVNGVVYGRKSGTGENVVCNADRTITLSHETAVGAPLTITVKNGEGYASIVSKHQYTIPKVYEEGGSLSGTDNNSIVYVRSGILEVTGTKEAKTIYVDAEAELKVTGTLNVDKLVLRTTPSNSAKLTNNGTLNATDVFYTRKIADNSKYYQFGLPLSCDSALNKVCLSDGTRATYGTAWMLKSYDTAKRAKEGNTANGDNWQMLTEDDRVTGGVGYEMFSGSKYYREFYFSVDLSKLTDTVRVAYASDDAGPTNAGWNVLVSPLTSTFTNDPIPEDITVSWMETDGFTSQTPTTTIAPAKVFSYQASKAGKLTFEAPTMVASAPRRRVAAAAEPERIQWMHLDIEDDKGLGDETSIYSHPTRYEEAYKTGIDVAKQSLTASRAILYSSHAYGDMAFAGVADALLEKGVALTIYSPFEQILTISMRDNNWLNRMAYVWLVDTETGIRTNLLNNHYTFRAAAGTTTGRFYIEGRFFAPQTPTDIENGGDGEHAKVQKIIYNDKLYILIGEQWYDATGKKVISK